MSKNVSFVEIQLSQVEVEKVLVMIQSFDLIFGIFEHRDTIVVFKSLVLEKLKLSFNPSDSIHTLPLIESCSGNSKFLLKSFFFVGIKVNFVVLSLFIGFEFYFSLF